MGRLFWAGPLLLAVLIAFATVLTFTPDDDNLAAARQRGYLRIGYAVQAPYIYVVPGKGVTGESAETATLVAERLGLRIEWVQTQFQSLIADLRDGRFDVVAAGMFVTPERGAKVDFSFPYLQVKQGLLVPSGNPASLNSYTDLLQEDMLPVAVVSGTEDERKLRARGMDSHRLRVLPDAESGRVAVETGSVAALSLSLPAVKLMAAQSSLVEAVEMSAGAQDQDPPQHIAFAIRKGEPSLLKAWNQALAEVAGSDAHLAGIRPFGFDRNDLVPVPHPTRENKND